ncbi:MAG: YitT family protein [Firmicutes bacterium]|nr:YitT family protein [Bacillota bacterium]
MEKTIDNAIEIIRKKNIVKRIVTLLFALLISAIVYNIFLLPANIVSGGVNGIGVIVKNFYNTNPAIVISIVLTICTMLSLIFLGPEKTTGTLIACAVYPFFVELTSPLAMIIDVDTNDMLLIAIFSGVLIGFANGLIYKTGYSNGGLQVISHILYKYYNIPIANSNLIINAIIVIIGGVFIGWTMVMYAIILLYISSIVIDKVLLGISNNKAFYIITKEDEKVKEYIINTLRHSVTTFDVKGAFLEKKRKVLLAVIPSREYFRVTEGIKLIDKDVFFVVTDAYQVEGGK